MEVRPRQVEHYLTAEEVNPYHRWLKKLDRGARGRIEARVKQIETTGHFGDFKPVGEGVFELRFFGTGPGYRVYFGDDEQEDQIVLLGGGDKNSQETDIEKCKTRWRDYNA